MFNRAQEIMSEGIQAAEDGLTCLDNPYTTGKAKFEAWVMGWEYYHIKRTGRSIVERNKQRWHAMQKTMKKNKRG